MAQVFRLDGAEEIPYLEGALGSAGYELEQPVAVGTAAGAEYEAVAVIDRSASEDNHALVRAFIAQGARTAGLMR